LLLSQVTVCRSNAGRENKSREDKSEDGEHYGVVGGIKDKGIKGKRESSEERCGHSSF
jgi:hypothetical protein